MTYFKCTTYFGTLTDRSRAFNINSEETFTCNLERIYITLRVKDVRWQNLVYQYKTERLPGKEKA